MSLDLAVLPIMWYLPHCTACSQPSWIRGLRENLLKAVDLPEEECAVNLAYNFRGFIESIEPFKVSVDSILKIPALL